MPELGATSSHIKYNLGITAAAATAATHPSEKLLPVRAIPYKNLTVFNQYLFVNEKISTSCNVILLSLTRVR